MYSTTCALSFLREIVAYYYVQNYVTPKSLNFFVGNSASIWYIVENWKIW